MYNEEKMNNELTASKIHDVTPVEQIRTEIKETISTNDNQDSTKNPNWNSSPLVPEVDEIPF